VRLALPDALPPARLAVCRAQRQSLWSLDMFSECNTGHGNSGVNDDPALGQHGMQVHCVLPPQPRRRVLRAPFRVRAPASRCSCPPSR